MFCFVFPGASKQLGILLEGESLLNDGTAIVLFNVILDVASPGHELTRRFNTDSDDDLPIPPVKLPKHQPKNLKRVRNEM